MKGWKRAQLSTNGLLISSLVESQKQFVAKDERRRPSREGRHATFSGVRRLVSMGITKIGMLINVVRGQRIMVGWDLAVLYGVQKSL